MFTDADLCGYLDEALPAEQMARVEAALRDDQKLVARLAGINALRDAGEHTLGDIWRDQRLSCPTREELGGFLLDAMSPAAADYIRFHIETIGCRLCQAGLEDLRRQQAEAAPAVQTRRTRFFQSSAGYLPRGRQ